MTKKKENTTSIGFEDAIWRAADKLRGNLNASEYEGVVLGLIFLKYISDKFEAKFAELSQDEYADVEDKDEYEADGEPFDEKMKRLTTELSGLFAESHRLEVEIKKQLGSIGYKI